MPPVPPPDSVTVGDAAIISLSAFAYTQSPVLVYTSPPAVNPSRVITPLPLALLLLNLDCGLLETGL